MKRLYPLIIGFTFSLVLSVIGCLADSLWLAVVGNIGSSSLGVFVTYIFDKLDTHGQGLRLWYQQIKYRNEEIRLSFSYLYKISVDGKYLLVKGNRLKNQYQPIGGVYKYYPEAKPHLEKFNYRPDIKMGNDNETDDLRLWIKGSHLLAYMDWFLSMKNREYDPYREFKEELLDTNLLPQDKFSVLKYRKVMVHDKGIQHSKFLGCNEYVYADIFELTLTEEQQDLIRKAVSEHPDQLCLATAEELRKECYKSIEKNLGTNCEWLIGG